MRFTVEGITIAESTHTSNRREAERILATKRAALVQQVVLAGKRPIKLHDAIDQFLRSRQHMPSYKNAKMHLDRFRPLPNNFLHAVADTQVQEVLDKRREEGNKESTVVLTLNYFNAMLRFVKESGYSGRERVKPLKAPKGKIRWLTDVEEAKLMEALDPSVPWPGKWEGTQAQRQDNYDLCLLLSHTAARFSEIADMTWNQVNFQAGTVTIIRGKGSNNSTIHMTRKMREVLERRKTIEPGDHVFSAKQGRHNETHWMRAAVRRAGLSEVDGSVTLHTLRHSRAVKWLQAGLNLLEVKEMLGHKSINSTMVYVHLVPGATARRAADLIDNAA
jgi:integrase